METLLARAWDQFAGRVTGPMTFRLVLQPAMAILLALRAGLSDARSNRSPYVWSVLTNRDERWELIRRGWQDVRQVFAVAFAMDAVYQALELRWFYPLQACLVAVVLAVVPYLAVRGPLTRVVHRRRRRPG